MANLTDISNNQENIIPNLKVVYHDDAIVIIDKPSGLLSVPGKAENNKDCVVNRALEVFPDVNAVHRLDMSTSGLMILAHGLVPLRRLSRQFEDRKVSKRYIALLHGEVSPPEGEIDAPLICDWENRPRQKVDFEIGKPSLTKYKVIAYEDGVNGTHTRMEFKPVTGRSHQLRVHSIHIGHPICGDHFYIGDDGYPRLMLHAAYIHFAHPMTGEKMEFELPTPF